MALTSDELSPDEFSKTASEAARVCVALDIGARAERLAGDGLLGILAGEATGGMELPLQYAVPVVSKCSEALLSFPLVETLLLARAFAAPAPEWASRIVAGSAIATVAWRGVLNTSRSGEAIVVSGTASRAAHAESADSILAFLEDGGAVRIDRRAKGVSLCETVSLAIDAPELAVTFDAVKVSKECQLSPAEVADLKRDALILQAAACLGSAEASLSLAVAHVATRRQFGTALVANQAVRHMLARHKLGIEGARRSIDRCFMATEISDLLAHSAFLQAVDAATAAAEGSIQLHGGMGYTWDVPVHRHLRAIRCIGERGDVQAVRRAIADDLIDANTSAA
jgi:alkylation response protein AidB-like acyl-CoA dehydrogenase